MSELSVRFRLRRRTAADWTSSNEVLLLAEAGLETDTRRVKYGDGVTAWNDLSYAASAPVDWGDIGGDVSDQSDLVSYISAQLAALVDSAPGALDTLNELAAALGDDPNFATTLAAQLAAKAPLASPALTGTPTAPTAAGGTNTTQLATTAFVAAALAGLGGGAWTAVVNTTISSPVANVVANVTGYNEALVIGRLLTASASGQRLLQASVDGGASFYSANGDYKLIAPQGTEANTNAWAFPLNSATTALTLVARVDNLQGAVKSCRSDLGSNGQIILFTASGSPVDRLRVSNGGGGNLTGGTVLVLAR